ncbi:unnamed protein product, partial [Ectocarpus fasciculatus]
FLTPDSPLFDDVLQRCYRGFVVEDESKYSSDFHERFTGSLRALESNTPFLKYDITQPGGLGTKIARTYVSRCVVGVPGITYKYLGLRIFAYPWTEGEVGATPETVAIGRLNDEMIRRSSQLLEGQRSVDRPYTGSCQYNLTLINRCFPDGTIDLKKEPMFEKNNCTVSWHADSSLEHFSTIGVYHVALDGDAPADGSGEQWRVSLRVRHDSEGPNKHPEIYMTPPVAVPLPRKCCYYMLDDLNHHHQHSVLVGGTHRFASTHRVCRQEGHTYASIQSRCKSVLQVETLKACVELSGTGCDVKQIRAEQSLLNEVEFEWIRQYYVQGRTHLEANVWWREPMQQLLQYWSRLEEQTLSTIQVLQEAAFSILSTADNTAELVEEECYDVLLEYIKSRNEKRIGWVKRCKEKMYSKAPVGERPVPPP